MNLKLLTEDMDSATVCRMTKEKEADDGDLDRCSYEVERDKRVTKIKKIMKPMEEAALRL